MTRSFFWVAAVLALSLLPLMQNDRAVAQQTGDASAAAEASTNDADAGASADTNATQSDEQADTQADVQASTSDDSAQASGQTATSDNAADTSQPAAANDSQSETSDADDQQPAPGVGPALPSPANDASANQPGEQSRLREDQQPARQPGQQDTAVTRDRPDASAQGRASADARMGRERQQDLRVGIQFGRITDRGLTINQIDRNNFLFSSGFRRGDVIVSVHGRPIRSDADFFRFVVLRPGERVPVVVLRDGRRETIYVVYRDVAVDRRLYDGRQYQASGAYLGVAFDAQVRDAVVIVSVNPGSPALEAGLQPSDILVALNGREVRSYPEVISIVRAMRPGDELEMIVERARTERQIVAVLDAPPSVRTAARPPVQVERRTTITNPPADVRIDVDRQYDDRLRDQDRDYDDGRRLLPRFRD